MRHALWWIATVAACSSTHGGRPADSATSADAATTLDGRQLVQCPTPSTAPGTATPSSWANAKAAQAPTIELTSELGTPYAQPLANLAWEDGIYITRDGLNLYAYYEPADYLSFLIAKPGVDKFYEYERGNLIGQDFSNPEPGETTPWIHADIAIAQRASTADSFTCWALGGLAFRYYNRGAPVGILNASDSSRFDYFAYLDDSSGVGRVEIIRDTPVDPTMPGTGLPLNVSAAMYQQDNPHLERVGDQLVLMYESGNQPNGSSPPPSGYTIWYTTSSDGGTTWTDSALVSTVDTAAGEDQPHLFDDGTTWWLYFTSPNPADGKNAIYRAAQGTPGNWDSWGARELVVSAGTTAGVGEATLTANGDLSFVAIVQNPQGTSTDKYDADPWFAKHL